MIRDGKNASLLRFDEARALVARLVEQYNTVRLHSAIGYIAPTDSLAGRGPAIWAERDRRLEAARDCAALAVLRATKRGPHDRLAFHPLPA